MTLGEPDLVQIKGAEEPVPPVGRWAWATGITLRACGVDSGGSALGMAAVEGLLERAIDGDGAVVAWWAHLASARPPGARGCRNGGGGVSTFRRLLRATHQTKSPSMPWHGCCARPRRRGGLDGQTARDRVRDRCSRRRPRGPAASDDLLGIAAGLELPKIDPDARRRWLTALVNAASLARDRPAGLFVIEGRSTGSMRSASSMLARLPHRATCRRPRCGWLLFEIPASGRVAASGRRADPVPATPS